MNSKTPKTNSSEDLDCNKQDLFFGAHTLNKNSANLAVLGVLWDHSSSYRKGSAEGPTYIRKATASQLYNPFSENGFNIKANWQIFDCGDVKINSFSSSDFIENIYTKIEPLHKQIQNYCFLGGDHLITYFSISALLKACTLNPKKVGLIYVDSHPDLYNKYDNNMYSHACVVRRIIEETGLSPGNICQLGIRASTPEQINYIKKKNILMYTTKDLQEMPITTIVGSIKERFHNRVEQIYLSVDLDVLDPAFVPGIGNPEPGGLSTAELVRLIQNLHILPITFFDLVEINPKYDLNNLTGFTAAKIMKEIFAILKK